MSGHSAWVRARRIVNGDMVQFVEGYILAMEDVLRDIEDMEYNPFLDDLARKVSGSRDTAQRTLETLTKEVDDATG